VEIVRRGFEVWNTGDMDALRELYDPGIVWRPAECWPEPGPYVGREAVMRGADDPANAAASASVRRPLGIKRAGLGMPLRR
jgi:ketosteroid isomerase-like protein